METTKKWLVEKLNDLGYAIEEESSFNYTNDMNPGKTWKARSCYIVQKNNGVSFANIYARRDENFERLQDFRFKEEYIINGRVYEL